jgi:hypothetical protein
MDELKRLYKDVVKAGLPLLVAVFNARPSFSPEATITHNDDSSMTTRFEARPNYTEALFDLRDTIPQLSEVRVLLEYVKAHDTIANDLLADAVGTRLPTDDSAPFFGFTVWPFLWAYLTEIATLETSVDDSVFNSLFDDVKTYLESTQLTLIYEAPIIGLRFESDTLELSDDIWIRRRTDEDIKRVTKPYTDFSPAQNEVSFNSHFLVVRTYVDKHGQIGMSTAHEAAGNVLSAFRLFKSGRISLGSDRQYMQLRVVPLRGESSSPSLEFQGGDYTLTDVEVDNVRALFNSCNTYSDKRWQLALRRLNLTYERKLDEDRLIDCWVGLETLLLPDGNKGELRYKGSLRLARFLGDTKEERVELQRDTKKSYDRRSEIVHGSTPLNEDLPQVTDKTIESLRRVLIQWLDTERSHNVEDIDAALLG